MEGQKLDWIRTSKVLNRIRSDLETESKSDLKTQCLRYSNAGNKLTLKIKKTIEKPKFYKNA